MPQELNPEGQSGRRPAASLSPECDYFRAVVESMRDGAAEFAADGTLLYCNAAFAAMAGFPAHELAGAPAGSLLDRGWDRIVSALLSVEPAGGPLVVDTLLSGPGGPTRPVHITASAAGTGESRRIGLVVVDRALLPESPRTMSGEEPLVVVNREGVIVQANRAASEFAGRIILREPLDRAFPVPAPDTPLSARIAPAFSGRGVRGESVRVSRDDRAPVELTLAVDPFPGDNGVPEAAAVAFTGLTASRRMEEDLRGNEERLRLALQAGGCATFVGDLESHRYYFDEAGLRLWELPQGVTFDEVAARFHPEDRQGVMEAARRSHAEGTGIRLEHRYVMRSGEVRWFAVRSKVMLDDAGRPRRSYGIAQDITARKQAEERLAAQSRALEAANQRLRDNEALLSALFESMLEPVIVVDRSGKIVLTNAALRNSFVQRSASPATLDDLHRLFAIHAPGGDPIPSADLPLVRALRGERAPPADIEFHDRATGRLHIASCSAAPILNHNGELTHALLACRDVTALRLSEKSLRDSEERFRMAAEVATEAIWDWDLRAGRVWRSHSLYRWYGAAPDGEPGLEWWYNKVHPEDRERLLAVVDDARKTPQTKGYRMEYRFQRDDGSWAYILDRAVVARDEQGHAVRLIGSMLDLTERRQAEQERERLLESERAARAELELSRSRMQLILASAGVGTWMADPATGELSGSSLTKSIYGQPPDEPITGDIWNVLHPDDLPVVRALVQRSLETREPFFSEHRIRLPGGSERWVRAQAAFDTDPSGGPPRLLGIVQDTTGQKQAEQKLRATAQRLGALVEANPIGIVLSTREGRILSVNTALLRMLDYAREEFDAAPRTWAGLTPPEWAAADARGVRQAREEGICRPYEKELLRKDGSRIPVMIGYALLERSRGDCVCFILDMTELKRARQDLEEKNRDLARSNEDLQRFAYVISHDLQEPLRMVSAFTELLMRRVEHAFDADSRAFARQITGAAERMRELIRGVLELSRVGHRAPEICEGVDSAAILGLALEHLRAPIEECRALVTAGPLPRISVDGTRLLQLFQNLIGNAVKYRRGPGPSVHVAAERSGDTWLFSVRDNGIGIDMQYASQIFLPFKRLHGRDQYPGTGVGLAVCKRIVEQHGGSIWVESIPGQGSTFYFTIPA